MNNKDGYYFEIYNAFLNANMFSVEKLMISNLFIDLKMVFDMPPLNDIKSSTSTEYYDFCLTSRYLKKRF